MWLPESIFGIPVKRFDIERAEGKMPRVIPMTLPVHKFVVHSGENLPKYRKGTKVYRFDWTPEEEAAGILGLIHQLRDVDPRRPAPHFSVGGGVIYQHREVGPGAKQGGALKSVGENPNMKCYQVECSTNTEGRTGVWDMLPGTHKPLVALMAYAIQNLGIPARIPHNWPDNCSDGPGLGHVWASTHNSRRLANVWNHEDGFFEHLEVSEGDNEHYDLLYWRRSKALADAQAILTGQPAPQTQPQGTPAAPFGPFTPVPFVVDSRVRLIQEKLNITGAARDSKWGPKTQARLVEYQTANGLPHTGQPDAATIARLFA